MQKESISEVLVDSGQSEDFVLYLECGEFEVHLPRLLWWIILEGTIQLKHCPRDGFYSAASVGIQVEIADIWVWGFQRRNSGRNSLLFGNSGRNSLLFESRSTNLNILYYFICHQEKKKYKHHYGRL